MSSRPERSDAHVPPEEEARLAEEAREYFDGIAPKRHTKPQRSEYSDRYSDAIPPSDGDAIPELERLRDLEAEPEKLVCDGSQPREEFVETEYYRELGCVDKVHHTGLCFSARITCRERPATAKSGADGLLGLGKIVYLRSQHRYSPHIFCVAEVSAALKGKMTGAGFIRMEKSNGSSSKLTSENDTYDCHPSCRGNPATNEWIPSADTDIPTSHKPNRSDI